MDWILERWIYGTRVWNRRNRKRIFERSHPALFFSGIRRTEELKDLRPVNWICSECIRWEVPRALGRLGDCRRTGFRITVREA
jgi:hypothetical protein